MGHKTLLTLALFSLMACKDQKSEKKNAQSPSPQDSATLKEASLMKPMTGAKTSSGPRMRDQYKKVRRRSPRGKELSLRRINRPHPLSSDPGPQKGKLKHNTERYDRIYENSFERVSQKPLSTFSVDVDTASYSNARRYLRRGSMPPKDAVRIEEFVNYFSYNYPAPPPNAKAPFSVNAELSTCPWTPSHRLLRLGVKGKTFPVKSRPQSNLVFLLDVSGSMFRPNKLPLLKASFKLLLEQLTDKDKVAIVVYAGASGVVLESTPASQKDTILAALNKLRAGGSTNGGAGIKLAYNIAMENFVKGGINRVILATDGDFNVGVSSRGALVRMVEERAKKKISLTVLGFGMGNYNDAMLEKLADKGNGNYAYIDTINEAKKVLVRQLSGTLVTIAKDVKIQIEFNPAKVSAYRLIGYENRILAAKDFNDDKKDAGEIGAGHTVTALYELVPPGVKIPGPKVDTLKYQKVVKTAKGPSTELLTVKLRFKPPQGTKSSLITFPVKDLSGPFASGSEDMRFAAAVASFAMLLRGSKYAGGATYDTILSWASKAKGRDPYHYRSEFISLVRKAQAQRK